MAGNSKECPYLVPVVADRLWVYPVGAYCRRPDGKPRIPSSTTLANVCTTSEHVTCTGYVAGRTEQAFISTITA